MRKESAGMLGGKAWQERLQHLQEDCGELEAPSGPFCGAQGGRGLMGPQEVECFSFFFSSFFPQQHIRISSS